jgi:hypothetical protein
MVPKVREWLAFVGVVLSASTAVGQTLPPSPVPVTAPDGPRADAPILGRPIPAGAATFQPPPPPPPPGAPGPAPQPLYAHDNPENLGLYGAPAPETLFFSWELQFVGPAIKNRLVGTNTPLSDGTTDTITVPAADLDWTASPRFELGYRLPENLGEFSLAYRFLLSEGSTNIPADAGTTRFPVGPNDLFVKSRLTFNVVDLDYATARFYPSPNWNLKWRVGPRLASIFFDSRQLNDVVFQRASNYFFGAGGHAGLDIERRLGATGLALYGRVDGAVVIGRTRQTFDDSINNPDGTVTSGFLDQVATKALPVLNLQVGLSYVPPRDTGLDFLRFTGGYQFERWWMLGKVGDSAAELTIQGIFLRAEMDF